MSKPPVPAFTALRPLVSSPMAPRPPVSSPFSLRSLVSTPMRIWGTLSAAAFVLLVLDSVWWNFLGSRPPKSEAEDREEPKRRKVRAAAVPPPNDLGGSRTGKVVRAAAVPPPSDPVGSNTSTAVQDKNDEDTTDAKDAKEDPEYLYHYTTTACKDSILHDRRIKKSTKKLNVKSARHGEGVYLTKISPNEGKQAIIHNNYDSAPWLAARRANYENFGQKADWYFRFQTKHLRRKGLLENVCYPKLKGDFDVWVFFGDIDLTKIKYDVGQTPNDDGGEANEE